MAVIASKQQGIVIKYGDGATPTEAFTTLAGVYSLTHSGVTRTVIDVTDFDSLNNAKEFLGGQVDYGTLEVTVHFDADNTTHSDASGILAQLQDSDPRNWQLTNPDANNKVWQFSGILQSFSVSMNNDDKVSADISLKVTGKPDYSVA